MQTQTTSGPAPGPMARGGLPADAAEEIYLTLTVADQLCGVPVLSIRDVLGVQTITRIPLAPAEVAGSLNLRGRIVTAIDLRCRLGLPPRPDGHRGAMSVVVEREGELYSLLADQVGEVLPLPRAERAPNPATLDAVWRDVSTGVHRIGERLLIVIDVERILAIG